MGYCLLLDMLFTKVAVTTAMIFPTKNVSTCVQSKSPEEKTRQEAPDGGCVIPSRTIVATAREVARACFSQRSKASMYENAMAIDKETAWPRKILRG